MRELLGRLACAALLVFGAALLVAGCGDDDDEQVAEALGGGEEDVDQLEAFFEELGTYPDQQVALAEALASGDVAGAREAVDEQLRLLESGREAAGEFESDDLRATVEEYLDGLQDGAEPADAFVAYFEDGASPTATPKQLLADLKRGQREAVRAEDEFARELLEDLPPEAEEQYREELSEFRERLRQARGASP